MAQLTIPSVVAPRWHRGAAARVRRLPGPARGHPGRGRAALDAGYRHIDTAAAYRNEAGVGAALAASGLPREEVFVTTKLWNCAAGPRLDPGGLRGQPRAARPRPRRPLPDPLAGSERGSLRRHLARVRADLRGGGEPARSASPTSASRISNGSRSRPTRDRPSTRSSCTRASSRRSCAPGTPSTRSPPRPGARSPRARLLDDETIVEIAERHGKTPAQAILRWHLQLGNVVIPKSVTPERIRENIELFDFELSDEEMAEFAKLDSGERIGPDPATFVSP